MACLGADRSGAGRTFERLCGDGLDLRTRDRVHAVADLGEVREPVTAEELADAGFGAGAMIFASSNNETLPSDSSVGNYKKAKLAALKNAGFILDFAHGNATTDIYAYLGAGMAAGVTYIIGEHAGEQGTVAVEGAGDWADRAAAVKVLARPAQPFNP